MLRCRGWDSPRGESGGVGGECLAEIFEKIFFVFSTEMTSYKVGEHFGEKYFFVPLQTRLFQKCSNFFVCQYFLMKLAFDTSRRLSNEKIFFSSLPLKYFSIF